MSENDPKIVSEYEKPQVKFNIVVDNSPTLWKPPIIEKPNAISPLSFELVQNAKGETVGYYNPYRREIWNAPITEQWFKKKTPNLSQNKVFHYIENEEGLRRMCENIKVVDAVAVDLEHHAQRSYLGLTCLLQLATDTDDYIVDVFKLWGKLQCLNETFTNPYCVKVFHGAQNDIIWLQRDLGIYVVGLFDTHEAAKALELPQRKLADLVHHYCGVTLDKSYQMSDWTIRPLSSGQLKYATMDTHYLLYIWQRMLSELITKDDTHNLIYDVIRKCKRLSEKCYIKPMMKENEYKRVWRLNNNKVGIERDRVLKKLYVWRDTIAREQDEGPDFILPTSTLLKIVQSLPTDESALIKCFEFNMSTDMKKYTETILNIIVQSINESTSTDGTEHTRSSVPATKAGSSIVEKRTELLNPPVEHMDFPKTRLQSQRKRFLNHDVSKKPDELTPNAESASYVSPYQRHMLYKYLRVRLLV